MTNKNIPILDLAPGIDSQWEEIQTALASVVKGGHFILGPEVKAFEKEVATYLGAKHAIGVNSGTDALFLGLRAAGINDGDEVITTPFTFFATAEAISHVGAVPVFADIDPVTFNISPSDIERKITTKTKAILVVHLFGQSCDMDAVFAIAKKHNLQVYEDVAQAFGGEYQGKKLGTLGAFGAFSFFPSKNLGCFGDGGLLTTESDEVAEKVRMLRAHGSKKKYYNEVIGYNSRLDEMQAAILRVRLRKIDSFNDGRRLAAVRYREMLGPDERIEYPKEAKWGRHVYHQYTVRLKNTNRDAVQKRLEEKGVSTMIYYPVPLHQLPVYRSMGVTVTESEKAASEVISLPIWPEITEEIQMRVVSALKESIRES